jgi:hypothetical protein
MSATNSTSAKFAGHFGLASAAVSVLYILERIMTTNQKYQQQKPKHYSPHIQQADKHYRRGVFAAIDRLGKLGEHNAALKLRNSFAKLFGE